jgi:hypothetical protein
VTSDFADFLDALNKEGAVYVVIGGMAVLFYLMKEATGRTEKDRPDLKRLKRLRDRRK